MNIQSILKDVKYTGNVKDFDTDFVTDDSRKVRRGCVFVCSRGASFDGHTFAAKALELGARLVVCEKDMGLEDQIIVENSRQAYSLLCSNLFDNPSCKMKMIGITGTNGKTTSAFLIKDLLEQQGKKVGLMGTVQNMIDQQIIPAKFTTPQPYELNALLSQMYKSGCEYVVMEVSSQALVQNRLYGIKFDVAVFTNLTQDHLDYHKTMDNYFDAKCLLFENSHHIIVNADDEWSKKIISRYKKPELITFSAKSNAADFVAKNITFTQNSVKFILVGTGSINRVDFPMPGEYSVHNAMGAALACVALGFSTADIADALCNVKGVKGRCEILVKDPFTVICDYAHMADGLENILSSLRPFIDGRMIVLFGCAGERDAVKRIPMAEAVARYADYVVFTSDNPRKEDPQSILDSVKGYFDEKNIPYIAEVDRRKAINIALNMLQYKDTLILCGKGHEDYQVLNGITVYLDEHEIVKKFMDNYRGK
ncbi:MAG: UDP-N-acetylmuramoyl-L-alanyl-D-glutamate--2,6-diaminopimelate ligase [Oscillospiraceae bacterium]|nr:UDP-N-acetylmuramoyl-L-alanyl-D-glutamate--2,6-diaminopimelate ligase [Oscillospiraceae bacterium]